MATKQKEAKIIGGWRKKQWFTILAPKLFNERPVGETPAFTSEECVGRTTSVNLMVLTGNIKKQNMNLMLEIDHVSGNNAYTNIKHYEVMPTYIKRIVRRGRDRIDETIKCVTQDKKNVIVKLLLVTANLAKSSQLKSLRFLARKAVVDEVAKGTFENAISIIIAGTLQKTIRDYTRRIFPLKAIEVKKAELAKAGEGFMRPEDLAKMAPPEEVEEAFEEEEEQTEEKPKKKLSPQEEEEGIEPEEESEK